MIFNINLRKLPSQYGEVSVMYANLLYMLLGKYLIAVIQFPVWVFIQDSSVNLKALQVTFLTVFFA